jgi:hypothetical protein
MVTRAVVCDKGTTLLIGWKNAREAKEKPINLTRVPHYCLEKPPTGRLKCNMNASFSRSPNKMDIGVCIRDDQDQFVLAKREWNHPFLMLIQEMR